MYTWMDSHEANPITRERLAGLLQADGCNCPARRDEDEAKPSRILRTTGVYAQYVQRIDATDKIRYQGLSRVADLGAHICIYIG